MSNNNLLIDTIVESILDVKGKEIIKLNLEKIENAFCENFIICHADSNTQVNAIAESIEKRVKENLDIKVHHREGMDNSVWVLLDYSNVLIHIFQTEYRHYYKLEELWGDAKITKVEESFN